jgi:precorrin-3B synthase
MNAAVAAQVKGWCPGALRPMQSGDGLIVRVRPACGAFDLPAAGVLADLAARLGNGHIDLTRRANLQLRGLTEDRLPELHAALGSLGLLDPDTETEAVRNVMVAPLAGLDPAEALDVRPIAAAIERALATDRRLQALPAKFGLMVDGGGAISIAGERADIGLVATGRSLALGLDTPQGSEWLGRVAADRAAAVAIAAAHAFLDNSSRGRMRDLLEASRDKVRAILMPLLSPLDRAPDHGGRRLGLLQGAVGIAAPFGRLEARQLRRLVALAAEAGAPDLRLSPWRSLYIGVRDEAAAQALLEGARAVGLVVDEAEPLLRIVACPGAPDCSSSSVDTRGDARRLAVLAARHGHGGDIHVSGCAKGCARSDPAELVLVGKSGGYWLIRNATTHGPVEGMIGPEEFGTLFEGQADV